MIGVSSLSTSVRSNISNLGSISGVEKRTAAMPAVRSVARASERAIRRPAAAAGAGRFGGARPGAAGFSVLFGMREPRLALYDTPRSPVFLYSPAYPPLRLIQASASRHRGKTSSTQAQNLAEWFISLRCMSSWRTM